MDVNGLRFWQTADGGAFGLGADAPEETAALDLHWRPVERLMRLDRQQAAPALVEDGVLARTWAMRASPVRDPGGSFAWWGDGKIMAAGFGPIPAPLEVPPDDPVGVMQPTDLAFGDDDVLYVARNDAVWMVDRRDRWSPSRVELPGFAADRLAPAPGGGVWALDRASGALARLTGYPLRVAGYRPIDENRFTPVEPNPRPPRLRRLPSARLPAGHEPIMIAASPGGRLAALAWRTGENAVLFLLEGKRFVRQFETDGLAFPYGLAWVGEDRVALLATDAGAPAAQALVYDLNAPSSETMKVKPMGDTYRLLRPWRGGFANSLSETPSYPTEGASPDQPGGTRPLHALSRAAYARSGRVTIGPFDSGQLGCVWDRLYLEASIADNAGVRIFAHADDWGGRPLPPTDEAGPEWGAHIFGPAAAMWDKPDAPQGAWCDEPSERAFHPGLLTCPRA
ncbi:MAG: hypothetical protein V4466_11500, partial [Pseudomonadota bacterium]